MASHGKVMDLFNDRELHLQDVYGNVEPLCTLVPYEEYERPILVYRIESNPGVFVTLLQDYTERKARQTGKEIWTWCVQWEVGSAATQQPLASHHSIKKPRLDSAQPNAPTVQPPRQNAGPITVRPCVIHPELMKRDDMQRILVDIVQVSSAVLPNFIEFLYRWVDYYLGDGKALKAALFGEIPSLWDFERHPVVVPEDIKKMINEPNSEAGDMSFMYAIAEEVAQNSPTKKMREKPDIAAFERRAEESERLQYREVRFGVQPPYGDEPLAPLINIPQNDEERLRYYVACYKSRQRAFYMLVDLGVTPQHMRDYVRGQKEDVKDTPYKNGDGLMNYARDARMAQNVFLDNEAHLRKQREIAISTKLDEEAQTVDYRAMAGPSGVPLIPPTPSRPPRRDVASEMMHKMRAAKPEDSDKIKFVPVPLVGKLTSEVFKDTTSRDILMKSLMSLAVIPQRLATNHQTETGANVSLPPPPVLPQLPNLPPLPQPSFPAQTNPDRASGNSFGLPVPWPPTPNIAPPPPRPSFPGSTGPPHLPPDFPLRWPSLGAEQLLLPPGVPPRLMPDFLAGTVPLGLAQQPPVAQHAPVTYGFNAHLNSDMQDQGRHFLPSPIHPLPPAPGIQRNAPHPLKLSSPPSPLSSLAASMLATSPFATSKFGVPIQIYFPRVVMPANIIGPGGAKLGDGGGAETDAFLIGHAHPGSGEITFSRAVFLPMGVWQTIQERVRQEKAGVLETYMAQSCGLPKGASGAPHRAAYEKLKQAYDFMIPRPANIRERELTKRWRVTQGPMTETRRGAVWEGWAVVVNKEIKMSKQDRTGALSFEPLINGADEAYLEKEARRKEMEAWIEEEEAMDDEEKDEDDDDDDDDEEEDTDMENWY